MYSKLFALRVVLQRSALPMSFRVLMGRPQVCVLYPSVILVFMPRLSSTTKARDVLDGPIAYSALVGSKSLLLGTYIW